MKIRFRNAAKSVFLERLHEIVCAMMVFTIGTVMFLQPELQDSVALIGFQKFTSIGFSGMLFFVIGLVRLISIAFEMFCWQSVANLIFRGALTTLSSVMLFQLALGFYVAGDFGSAGFGKYVYPFLALLDVVNTYYAIYDIRGVINAGFRRS